MCQLESHQVVIKVLSRTILTRMQDPVEEKLRDEEAGSCRGCSCCDQITTLRIIKKQTLYWNTGLYMVFVYFEKAFNSLDHIMLWKILTRYGIPAAKIVRMFQVLYDGFQARVLHEGRMTKSFEMKTRVQQGSLLNPLLLLVTLDWLTTQVYSENTTRNLQFPM